MGALVGRADEHARFVSPGLVLASHARTFGFESRWNTLDWVHCRSCVTDWLLLRDIGVGTVAIDLLMRVH